MQTEKECNTPARTWIKDLIRGFLSNLEWNFINLSFIKGVKLGKNVKIHKFVNAWECEIGNDSVICSYTEVQKGVKIGSNCRIGSHSFLCSGVELGSNVFFGSSVICTNDKHPTPNNKNYKQLKTIIGNNVSVGSGVTLLPGIEIGEGSLIGGGSTVSKNVGKNEVWFGNPAVLKATHFKLKEKNGL